MLSPLQREIRPMTMFFVLYGVLSLLLTLTLASDSRDIVTYLQDHNFTVIIDDLNLVGLTDKLRNEGPFTVFVPTDEAFLELPTALRDGLHKDLPKLKHIVLSHVLSGGYIGPVIPTGSALTTLSGQQLHFSKVPDGSVSVNGIELLGADIVVKNGVIHSIEKVLLPPTETVMEYLASHRQRLSIIESLIYLARMDSTLQGQGPYTVFLPIDEVFMNNKSQFAPIFGDSSKIREMMMNHAANGTLYTTDLTDGQSLQTMGTKSFEVSKTYKGLKIEDAEVIQPNIPVTNGVIHITDRVLQPKS